jgi:S-adenosylmethionine:tRNA ribosyltransferase-isomerase
MLTADFDYDLPRELIAQSPAAERSASRLMILNRASGGLEHTRFGEIVAHLRAGDVLVLNNTKVLAARLQALAGRKKVEILLLEELGPRRWSCLAGPGRNARPGDKLAFADGCCTATVVDKTDFGGRVLEFDAGSDPVGLMEKHGQMPLPPYISAEGRDRERDCDRYQTVFAEHPGAVAAPTAALHFTEPLLDRIARAGVEICKVTLHVGLGTFRPVKTENVEEHVMHEEKFRVPRSTVDAVLKARREGRRVIAAGTTAVRALEASIGGGLEPGIWHPTRLFIVPGYRFAVVDALLTNFHLPRSTLLMLVSAFAGRESLLRAYQEAIRERYRFFSYGDAMLIL